MSHQKPTKEELAANVAAAAAALEKKPDDGGEKPPVTPPAAPVVPPVVTPNPDENDGGEKPPVTPPADGEPPEEDETTKLKKKLSASASENQIIYAQNQKMNDAIDKASEVAEPTEAELIQEFPDWEGMSQTEQKLAKASLHNDRRLKAITDASKDFKDLKQWQSKVNEFIDNPENLTKNPLLEGKEDEFKLYALKPTRRGVDFDDLVAGFLYSHGAAKPKNKGQMFPTGSGGDKKPVTPKSTKLSVAEAAQLRETNYTEYRRQLRAGNIDNTIE